MARMSLRELPEASSFRLSKVVFCLHGLFNAHPSCSPPTAFIVDDEVARASAPSNVLYTNMCRVKPGETRGEILYHKRSMLSYYSRHVL